MTRDSSPQTAWPVVGTTTAALLMACLIVVAATPHASAAPRDLRVRSGWATFYDPGRLGACSLPQPALHAALNPSDYRNARLCGATIRVVRGTRAVNVRVTNLCPECPPGAVDLSPAAFRRLARPVEGRVRVRWRVVSPGARRPIRYRFKEGSSRWWTAVQVRNHRNPIARLEVRRGGRFRALPRTGYNYFVARGGLGPGPYVFRVTDIYGQRLVDRRVPLRPTRTVSGRRQFSRRR
jgi:expansin (peptidoglycan-binding protein)